MNKKILAGLTAVILLFGMMVSAQPAEESMDPAGTLDTQPAGVEIAAAAGTAEVDHSKLLPIFEEDFTKLQGATDAALKEELAADGWTVGDWATNKADQVVLSKDAQKGLYMKRSEADRTMLPIVGKIIADTNGKVNAADAAVSGYNMKSKGKYYVAWTATYNGTFSRFCTEGTHWSNVFARCDMSYFKKSNAEFYTDGVTYMPLTKGREYLIEAVVDTKGGNLDGSAATATISGYINGTKILDNKPVKKNSNGYATFLYKVFAQLQAPRYQEDPELGLYWKNVKIAKIVDEGAANFDKAYQQVAPQTEEPLDALTQNLTLPNAIKLNHSVEKPDCTVLWTSSDGSVISDFGEITRAADGDKTAVLTAAITGADGETCEKTFTVTVKQQDAWVEDTKSITYATLTDEAEDPAEPPVAITKSLTQPLPDSFGTGGTIAWESSDTEWLLDDGVLVKRPGKGETDRRVDLKATFTMGQGSIERTYQFLILKPEGLDTIDDDAAALNWEAIRGDNPAKDQIIMPLHLPKKGVLADSDIVWSAQPAENCPIDMETGKVLAPGHGEQDASVTLTATLSSPDGGTTKEVKFDLVVPALYEPTDNLALGKTAMSKDFYASDYQAPKAFDGNRNANNSRWASKLTADTWLYVDLGKSRLFNQVEIYEFLERMLEMRIEYSDDAQNWETLYEATSEGGTSNKTHHIRFSPVQGRYVRLYIVRASEAPSIYEFEVYDTATRKYALEAAANDSTLGSVKLSGKTLLAAGEPVTLTAEPTKYAKFLRWEVPEGIVLKGEGAARTDQEISFDMPAQNTAVTAVFEAKAMAVVEPKEAVYDKYEKSANHKEITVTLSPNEFTFMDAVKAGKELLAEGEQYTKQGNVFTFKQAYLESLTEKTVILFQMDDGVSPSLTVDIVDTHPEKTVAADMKQLTLPSYELKDGDVIPAVGATYGTDISVTSSNTAIVSITRETQGGVLVNKIHINPPRLSTLVTLTVTGSREDVKQSVSHKFNVKGTGGGSTGGGGSSGGGGGGSYGGGGTFGGGTVDWNSGMGNNQGGSGDPVPDPAPDALFGDMDQAQWALPYVEQLYEKGIVGGDENGNFNPNNHVTREEFIKMAVLSMDIAPGGAAVPFADVETDAWYYPYVAAAYEKDIVSGLSQNAFGVGAAVTRQDAAVMLDRVSAEIQGATASDLAFTDAGEISGYAADSVKRVLGAGLMQGYPDGSFRPAQALTRAETVKVLAELMKLRKG